MAIAQNACFAALCGLVVLGADYGQQSRRAQMPFGQMGLRQYSQIFSSRFGSSDSSGKIDLGSISDVAAFWGPTNDEPPVDLTAPQVMANPVAREDRTGVRVNKGLNSATVGGGCVRRGNLLSC